MFKVKYVKYVFFVLNIARCYNIFTHSFPTIWPNKEIQCILFQTPQIALESFQSRLLI